MHVFSLAIRAERAMVQKHAKLSRFRVQDLGLGVFRLGCTLSLLRNLLQVTILGKLY